MHTHTHTDADAYRGTCTVTHKHSDYTKQQTAGRLGLDKRRKERKTWQVYSFGKRIFLDIFLFESREGFCRRGRGRSYHVDGLKTEKMRERPVNRYTKKYTKI